MINKYCQVNGCDKHAGYNNLGRNLEIMGYTYCYDHFNTVHLAISNLMKNFNSLNIEANTFQCPACGGDTTWLNNDHASFDCNICARTWKIVLNEPDTDYRIMEVI